MNPNCGYLRLRCPVCSWSALCDQGDMIQRLRKDKMLRRQGQPDDDLVIELFRAAAGKMGCDRCENHGLICETPPDEDLDWGEARRCEQCNLAIPAERLELFPDAQRCAKCQASLEARGAEEEPEYCPNCGSVLVLRPSTGAGITRYRHHCEACGR